MVQHFISLLALIVCLLLGLYWFTMALASIRSSPRPIEWPGIKLHRFGLVLPAHDEESVIAASIRQMKSIDYPADLFNIYLVADHCSDRTAEEARQAGAIVYERNEGPRSGKGAALNWLFGRILDETQMDAVVIFDADTRIDPAFLRMMNIRLNQGEQVIQGCHVISNPEAGWFPALTWAMFLIDNRFQNLGRANLGWSAKHMGDSICFRITVLKQIGVQDSLVDDYEMRQRLLLAGIKIAYEQYAIGYGEAPLSFSQAYRQRLRWLRGARDTSKQNAPLLLAEWRKSGNGFHLDGALQSLVPSYSTLTLFCLAVLALKLTSNWLFTPLFTMGIIIAWLLLSGLLFIYPLFGLYLERAPLKAYLVILTGPFFMIWRTMLVLRLRFVENKVTWVRTQHGVKK